MDKKVLPYVISFISRKQGDAIAIEETGKKISYGALESFSNQIAHCLLESGIKPGEVAGVYLPSGINYVSSILGINKAGGVFMPLELSYPVKRLQYLIEYVKPLFIITKREHVIDLVEQTGLIFQTSVKLIIVDENNQLIVAEIKDGQIKENPAKQYSKAETEVSLDGECSNYLLYTSGSTGVPKIIEGCHKGLSHFIHWEKEEFKLDKDIRVSQLAPTTFDVSLRDIFVPLLSRGTLCVPTTEIKSDPGKLIRWLIESEINLIHTVPSMFRLLTKEVKENRELLGELKNLKYILLAGEAVYGKDIAAWREITGEAVEIINLYGPTETTLAKIFNRIKELPEDPHAIIPLGKPISNTGIIISKNNRLCEVGAIGEIYIKTPFRSKGYFRNAEMTHEKFVQNPLHSNYEDIVYKTGDLGKYLKDGKIAFVGRQDSQVKIRGNRVELTEVERVLSGFSGIEQVSIQPIKKTEGEEILACYYVEKEHIEEGSLKNYIQDYLPDYMHPSYYIKLEEFPLNLNGKIDKRALPTPDDLIYEQLAYQAPASPTEEALAKIWSEVLGLKKVGVTNSFFELGGHSLSATKVVSRIYKQLGKEVSLKDFFDHPTIRKLTAYIQDLKKGEYEPIPPIPIQEHYALSHAQKLIWILEQSEEGMTAYNMVGSYILQGKIDKSAFQKSFQTLVQRHESLRTNVRVVAGEPRQVIREQVDFQIEENDETGCEEAAVIEQYVKDEHKKPFHLSNDLLFRAKFVQLKEEKFLFLFTMHHLISDGWSRGVLAHEILRLYKDYKNERKPSLAPLKIQYKEYVYWHNQKLRQEGLNSERAYWHKKLSGQVPVINLPYDFARSEERTYVGAKYPFTLTGEDSLSLRELCKSNDVSLFTAMVAIIKVLLYHYSGQKDILIGSPISGRNHIDLENLIGVFINNLVLRSEISNLDTFKNFLIKTRQVILEAYEHQNYPYEKLVEELGIDYKKNRNPLYDVLVVMDNSELNGSNKDMEDLKRLLNIEEVNQEDNNSKLDLTFFINDSEEIRINIEYKSELFKQETILKIKDAFVQILKIVTKEANTSISDITKSLLTDGEKDTYEKISQSNVASILEEF